MMRQPTENQKAQITRAWNMAADRYGDKELAHDFMEYAHPACLQSDKTPTELILGNDAERVFAFLSTPRSPAAF